MGAAVERLMTRKEAAEFLGFAPQTLARFAWQGKGPKVTKVGRAVRYKQSDLDEWVKEAGSRPAPAKHEKKAGSRAVYVGRRITIGGEHYYREADVAKAMARLGAVWMCTEQVKECE